MASNYVSSKETSYNTKLNKNKSANPEILYKTIRMNKHFKLS